MHPKYQKRIFFTELWSKEELENWGKDVFTPYNHYAFNRLFL